MSHIPHRRSRTLASMAILTVFALIVSACQAQAANEEAAHEVTEEPTHEATEEATHEATGEATHEATGEATEEIPAEFEDLQNPFAGDPAAIAAGMEIYTNNCALCHGETGEADGPAAAGLPDKPARFADCEWQAREPDGELFYVIVNGKPDEGMPAWGETLTEDQMWQVLSYERSFCD